MQVSDNDSNTADERRQADLELFHALRVADFDGPTWEGFAQEAARYALGVLLPWMRDGRIFAKARAKRIPVYATVAELRRFEFDEEFRTEIANAAVAQGLRTFQLRCRAGRGWSQEGGASLATFFLGRCLCSFVDELAKHRRAQQRHWKAVDAATRAESGRPRQDREVGGPEQRVTDGQILEAELSRLAPCDRIIVWRKVSGWTNREIALHLGISVRTVEQRWSWLRAHVEWIGRLA